MQVLTYRDLHPYKPLPVDVLRFQEHKVQIVFRFPEGIHVLQKVLGHRIAAALDISLRKGTFLGRALVPVLHIRIPAVPKVPKQGLSRGLTKPHKNRFNMPYSLRNTIFWLSDLLKGAKICKHYEAVIRINEDHESDYAVRERKKYLSEILRHCRETVPYYRNLGITDALLYRFPVIDKNLIKKDPNPFVRLLTRTKKRLGPPPVDLRERPLPYCMMSTRRHGTQRRCVFLGGGGAHLGNQVLLPENMEQSEQKGRTGP